jgi:hypothetical protein
MWRAVILGAVVAGCAHPLAGEVRYKVQPPVWRVNDRVPLDRAPAERDYNRTLYHIDGFFVRRLTRAMDMQVPVRAAEVNSLDEVPDSTWFTNRIGVRDMSIEELTRGANVDASPFEHLPWTIKSAKVGGTSVGFVFEDTRGEKFLLKFDAKDAPEMETGAHIIGHRIVWACGYNVPQDYLGYLRREDLKVAPDATKKNTIGEKSPLTVEHVDEVLTRVFRADDGRFRVMASQFIPGKPIGPTSREGRRADDPNDVFPHEQRRSLRGQYAIFSWLNHTDIQEDQTLDVFVPDAPESKRGFVMHYTLDFGKSLGVMGYVNRWRTVGYTFRLDLAFALQGIFGLGLWERPWEEIDRPELRGIGLWTAEHYDPGSWRTNSQYWPYLDKDRFDAFWGAKLIMRFTRDQLAAIVAEAHYSDPRSAAYMLDVLVERQRKTARYWFNKVAPLDRFTVAAAPSGVGLCFDDLTLSYGLDDVARGTGYHVDTFDHAGRPLGAARKLDPTADGHVCVDGVTTAADDAGYTIVRIRVQRNARIMPAVLVHLARDAAGAFTVIGLRRE